MSRPKSPDQREIEGNLGHRPIPEVPELEPMVCVPPSWLDAAAVAIWNRVAGELVEKKLLFDIDRDLLGTYCQHLANGIAAQMVINEHGLTMGTDKVEKRPEVLIMRDSFDRARHTAAELGLTPSARYKGVLPGSGELSRKKKEGLAKKYGVNA